MMTIDLATLNPAFIDAVMTGGRLVTKCGFCGRVHFCLDDPAEGFEPIEATFEGKTMSEADLRAEMVNSISGFDSQMEQGINSCYDPKSLVRLLYRIDPEADHPFGDVLEERVAAVFRISPERAKEMIAELLPSSLTGEEATMNAVPHIMENIPCGMLDGKPVVPGCTEECDRKLLQYQNFIYIDRQKIVNFLEVLANQNLDAAQTEKNLADRGRKAVPDEQEEI